MLTISKIKIYPYKKRLKNGVIGIGQVVFDGGLLLSGLELVERHNKRFIVYPKNPNNNHDLCYCQPTNAQMNKFIADALFKAYDDMNIERNVEEEDDYWNKAVNEFANDFAEKQAVVLALKETSTGPEPSGENLEVVEE